MEFSRQEYWSNLPLPSPGDLPNPGIEPRYPALQADSLLSESPGKPKNTEVSSLSPRGERRQMATAPLTGTAAALAFGERR